MQFDLDRLALHLHDSPIGHTIDYHPKIPSTMPVAHALAARAETRSGTIVVAEEQTTGRGRHGRRWDAPRGQALLLSLILKPPLGVETMQLPMAVGVGVVNALEQFEPSLIGQVGLKWPNDVLLGRSQESAGKVAGSLIETAYGADQLAYAVIGIGINVNQTGAMLPPGQPGAPTPISLRLFLDRAEDQPLDRTALFVTLCHSLTKATLLRSDIFATWRARLWTLGSEVTVYEEGNVLCQGRAIDVTPDGSLLVADEAGAIRRFVAGDVSLRRVLPQNSLQKPA